MKSSPLSAISPMFLLIVGCLASMILVSGCTTVETAPDYAERKGALTSFVVVPALVDAMVIVSDSSTGYRPLITEENQDEAKRLTDAIAVELESSLRRSGARAAILSSGADRAVIDEANQAFARALEQILKAGRSSSRRAASGYAVDEAAALGRAQKADAVVLGLLRARAKGADTWRQNFVDSGIQAAIQGSATVFERSTSELHLAVVDAATGKILWHNHRGARTYLKDGTTPGAIRRFVQGTFRPFLSTRQ